MKHILLFGAGKSASVLIGFLKDLATAKQWRVTVADVDLATAQAKVGTHALVKAVRVDLADEEERSQLVAGADVVISLLPPSLQLPVAQDCLAHGKHLLSASYTDSDLVSMKDEIEKKGLLFLCEMGLDPGIDHMSAMQLIDGIHAEGGTVNSFRSHCGGLVAPESDNNPWHYKFSWNPRNVVMAGKAGAVFKEEGEKISKEYETLFADCEQVMIEGIGPLAFYYNRDSLGYMPIYKLEDASTFVRTTLRYPVFCKGWDIVIALGLTNDKNTIQTDSLTIASFFGKHVKESGVTITEEMKVLFDFLGFEDHTMINKGNISSADVLQWILEQKWALEPQDKDMIVMLHEIGYTDAAGEQKEIKSQLIVKGKDHLHTAMAKTVGLPLGIAAQLLLEDKIAERGLHIPIVRGIYQPVLDELVKYGIRFD